MTTLWFHPWPYGTFIEIQNNLNWKKLHRTNQGSNFLGASFSNKDNARTPIQFRRERQPQHLKRWFFLKNRPVDFHINSTSVLRLVKQSKLSFSRIEINKPHLGPIHSIPASDWRSDSSSKTNYSYCHRSDSCSH